MPSISSFLSDLSRRKLDTAASGRDGWRDTLNLRRFVLLKNSITQAETPPPSPSPLSPIANIPARPSKESSNNLDSEEAWLESVLENLEKSDDNEVEVKVAAVDEEFTLFESELDDPFECWISSYDVYTVNGPPFPLSSDSYLSSPSVLPSFQPPVSLQFLIDSSDCPFRQDYVEPRYPEADLDLPLSDTSSDGDSEDDDDDDDDGPPTPYSGSQPSLREQPVVEPQVYIEPDMYFLCPSELSPPPHFQHC